MTAKIKLKPGKETPAPQTQEPEIPLSEDKVLTKGQKIKLTPLVTEYAYPPLPTVTNAETGSVFSVIGTTVEGLRVSFRAYLAKSDVGFTRIDVRVRIGDQLPGASAAISVPAFMELQYPSVYAAASASSKGHAGHLSIEGAILLPCHPWEKEQAALLLLNSPVAKEFYEALVGTLKMQEVISVDHFRADLAAQVKATLKDLTTPSWVNADKVVRFRLGLTEHPLAADKPAS